MQTLCVYVIIELSSSTQAPPVYINTKNEKLGVFKSVLFRINDFLSPPPLSQRNALEF